MVGGIKTIYERQSTRKMFSVIDLLLALAKDLLPPSFRFRSTYIIFCFDCAVVYS